MKCPFDNSLAPKTVKTVTVGYAAKINFKNKASIDICFAYHVPTV